MDKFLAADPLANSDIDAAFWQLVAGRVHHERHGNMKAGTRRPATGVGEEQVDDRELAEALDVADGTDHGGQHL